MASKRTVSSDLPSGSRSRRTRSAAAAHSTKSTSLADSTFETTAVSESLQSEPDQAEPNPEEIARLAYAFWEERGGIGGSDQEDWLRAERVLRSRASAATSA
jgi:hypothetical protein